VGRIRALTNDPIWAGVFDLGDVGSFSVLLGGPAAALPGKSWIRRGGPAVPPSNAVAPAVPGPSAWVLVLCGLPVWLLARVQRNRRR